MQSKKRVPFRHIGTKLGTLRLIIPKNYQPFLPQHKHNKNYIFELYKKIKVVHRVRRRTKKKKSNNNNKKL